MASIREEGNVHLDTRLFDTEPALDAGDWDEVIDTNFISTTGYARIGSYEHAMDLNIAHQGPGTHRLRLHARGRDSQPGASRRRNSKPTAEHYLFHIWPDPAAPAEGPTKDHEDAALHGSRQYGIRVHVRRTADGEDYLVQTWMHGNK